jgi:hypothetical protein
MMKTEVHSDIGTVLQPSEYCAIWSPTEGYSFLVPPGMEGNAEVPEHAMALMAAVIRLQADEDFRADMLAWLA